MSGKLLLKEYYSFCPGGVCQINLLTEEEKHLKDQGFMIMTGVLQRADSLNQNGRIYPRKVLEREVEKYQRLIQENQAFGELDHAETSIVSLKNVCMMILRTWWSGSELWGTIKITKTPSGQIVEGLVNSGAKLGVSSRALGELTETPRGNVVGDSLEIVSWDIVSLPSTNGATLQLKEVKNIGIRRILGTKVERMNVALDNVLQVK
ncbi:MAG: hypothetical protein H7831_13755 [Magnetococcus sp. WYHC-3]